MNFMYYLDIFVHQPPEPEAPVEGELLEYMIKKLRDIDPKASKHMDNMGNSIDNTRQWKTASKSLLALSRQFPGAHITLREECLDAEEYIMHHFLNGQTYEAVGEVKYPPFDPNELA